MGFRVEKLIDRFNQIGIDALNPKSDFYRNEIDQKARLRLVDVSIENLILKNPSSPLMELKKIWEDLKKDILIHIKTKGKSWGVWNLWEPEKTTGFKEKMKAKSEAFIQALEKASFTPFNEKITVPFSSEEKKVYSECIQSILDLIPMGENSEAALEALQCLIRRKKSNSLESQTEKFLVFRRIQNIYENPDLLVTPPYETAFRVLFKEKVEQKIKEISKNPKGFRNNLEFSLSYSHQYLVELVKSRYEKAKNGGVCHGFSLMGMQAILSECDLDFTFRIDKIALLLKIYKNNIKEIMRKIEKDKDSDLLAFFEGLELGQQAGVYPFLFESKRYLSQSASVNPVISLIGSLELEAKGGAVDLGNFTGVYQECDLIQYFESLEEILKEKPLPQTPLALILSSLDHSITVGYNPMQKVWFFLDANKGFLKSCKEAGTIAKYVEEALHVGLLSKAPMITQITQIYVGGKETGSDVQFWRKRIDAWQKSVNFRKIHEIPLNHSSDITPSFFDKKSLWLLTAAKSGNEDEVNALICAKASVNEKSKMGWTALQLAAQNGHLEVVKALIAAKAIVDEKDERGVTALIPAAENGHLEVVKALIAAKASVNEKDERGVTALMPAAENGHLEVVKALIVAKASVNEKSKMGWTALRLAAQNGHLEVVKALIAAKAIVDEKDKRGVTALIPAAENGHLEVVKALIAAKASVNEKSKMGWTALLLAAKNGHLEVVKALIAAKASVNETDKWGVTALLLAVQNGHLEVVKALIAAEVNVNLSFLVLALVKGHLDVAQELVKAGGAIDVQSIIFGLFWLL